ncbi:preprotein translocase subunit YajC [Brevundimonas sp. AJA228-03]|uniref:preprotein translocase subunit YajC n=1 Tax=Brevundimonas sp. AJA228-03 TaxID=2752515 RepID=UPI001ADF2909|nr:preprotein translocase subunit YajC [Brevundimonas sp. AJA228-03]QTN18978.1 preprotein translocase subunit YajC [Brevundimonas sp. AJA228-03]
MTPTADGGPVALIVQFLPFVAIFVLFYFLLIRPQQKRAKEHQALIAAVKRGDTIVLSSGLIGKVTRVEEAEVNMEIAPSVNVRVVKAMIAEVRNRTAIAANDAKPAPKAVAKS